MTQKDILNNFCSAEIKIREKKCIFHTKKSCDKQNYLYDIYDILISAPVGNVWVDFNKS